MNYLAHAILSFQNDEILVGNMISDFVKGKTKFDYPPMVQNGIALHRMIDEFTDQHTALQEAKAIFKPTYRLYSSAIVDVVLDFFVANLINDKADLQNIVQHIYQRLQKYTDLMPLAFKKMLPHMTTQNWLYNYQFDWGIQKSLTGLMRRANYITEVDTAYHLFTTHQSTLQQCFYTFWPQVQLKAANYYKKYTFTTANPLY